MELCNNDNLISEYQLLSANPTYWDIDMSQVDLRKAAELVKVGLKYGRIPATPVATRRGLEGFKSKFRAEAGHTAVYAATKLYKTDSRFEFFMCLLLNHEVRPGVPALDVVQSDEWIKGFVSTY